MKHWTEKEIQRHLDANTSSADAARMRHLRACKSCGDLLKQYRLLYGLLKTAPPIRIPEHFARKTAAKAEGKNPFLSFILREPLWMTAGLALILGAWFYFYAPPSLLDALTNLGRLTVEIKNLLPSYCRTGFDYASPYLPEILLAGSALAIAALLDRFLLQPRLRRLRT